MSEHRARKRFGQNFLHDPGVIQRIVRHIAPKAGQHLVEIGPGQGALTGPLLESGCQLDVVELDRDLVPRLQVQFAEFSNLTIHSADALKFDFSQLVREQEKLRIVGNLPYNISTPLIFHLLDNHACIEDMHFMLQKEVVERLTAQPGSKQYGRLGVMVSYYCETEYLFRVGPGAFKPAPKVDSAIVRLVPRQHPPVEVKDLARLGWVVTQVFSQRRKTLRNTLKTQLGDEDFARLGINPQERAEQLALADFAALANAITESEL